MYGPSRLFYGSGLDVLAVIGLGRAIDVPKNYEYVLSKRKF